MKRFFLPIAALLMLVSSCFVTPDITFKDGTVPELAFSKTGGTLSFSFNATSDWSATTSAGWLTLNPDSGIAGDFNVTVKAAANDTPDDRSATITVQCGDVVKTVSVQQKQKDMLTLSKSIFEVGEEGGRITVDVSCNVPVSARVLNGSAWISQTKGLETSQFSFEIAANTGEDERTGEIEIYSSEAGLSEKVTVSQKAPAIFELSASETTVESGGGTFTVTVRSSLEYSISSMPEWVKQISVKAVSKKVHTFEVAANPDQEVRSGVIVFCNESGVCVPFNVNQEAAPEPEPGIDWSRDFAHKSLIMRFTATWCGYCPIMAETVALAQSRRPGRYEPVNIHGGSSDLEFSSYKPLMSDYKISGYPTSVVDGRRTLQNYNSSYGATLIEKFQDETESSYPTATAVGIRSVFSGNELSVDVDVFCKEADSYKLTVMVLEDGIVGYQADYTNGDHAQYTHDAVARLVLTDVRGDAFSTVEEKTAKTFSFKADISKYVKDNLRVLVYVQREFGTQKKQTDYSLKFYVDNAASAKAGMTLEPALK